MVSNTSYDVSGHGKSIATRYAMSLFTVEEFYRFWPQIEKMLDAVPHTWRYWSKDDMYSAITASKIQVWGMGPPNTVTIVFMTSVNVFPALRVLTLLWAAGHFEDEMASLLDATLADYAKLNECTEIEVRGRPGWYKQLKRAGFRKDAEIWTRSVPDTRIN
jgi:hypothetical protein